MSAYAQLQADIAATLARTDLTAVIPSFVTLAEQDIADDFRVRDMIRRARATGADPASRYLPIPDGLLEFRRLEMWPDSDRRYSMIQVTPENLQVLNLRDTSTSSYNRAQRYTVHREIEFDAPIDDTAEIEMIYYVRYPALANDADTNWLLQNAYGAYLYGSLLHTTPYLRNPEMIPVFEAGYSRALTKTQRTEQRGRVNQAEARVMVSGATP